MSNENFEEAMRKHRNDMMRTIFDEYCNYVYIIAASKIKNCGTKEDIEECVSDVFAELFRNSDIFSLDSGKLKSYVGTIAKRRAIDTYRRLNVRFGKTQAIDDDIMNMASGEDIEKSLEICERNALLLRKIIELGEPDSTIIIKQFYYNMKIPEIARSISMTAAAVQKRSKRAREKLRSILADSGIIL